MISIVILLINNNNIYNLFIYEQINAAAEVIYEAVDPNANIIFGALVDPAMTGEVAITVIATGLSRLLQ